MTEKLKLIEAWMTEVTEILCYQRDILKQHKEDMIDALQSVKDLPDEKADYERLYLLVEAYLVNPNLDTVKDDYDALVAWYVRSKRPDGTEPRPVSTQ